MAVIVNLAGALLLTIAAEGILMYLWSRRRDWTYYSFLCNCMTNPVVNVALLGIYNFTELGYYGPLAVLEILAWLAEALVYMRLCDFSQGKALAVSLVLNLLSFGAGLVNFLVW